MPRAAALDLLNAVFHRKRLLDEAVGAFGPDGRILGEGRGKGGKGQEAGDKQEYPTHVAG